MPNKIISITFDFFRVGMGMNVARTFSELIHSIADSPDDDGRTRQVGEHHYHMHECEKRDMFWFGNITKIRMDEYVVKTKLSGQRNPVDLEEDEGIGRESAFAYNEYYNVIVLQRNKNTISSDSLAAYIEKVTKCFPLSLDIVLQKDALKKFESAENYKTVDIKIAKPDSGLFLGSAGETPEYVEKIMKMLDAPELELRLSVGRKKKRALSRSAVQNLVSKFLGRREYVEKLNVNGIELIDGVMSYSDKLNPDSAQGLSYEARWGLIKKAWSHHLPEIAQLFGGKT